ncbi:hypothetical protein [Spiroplasma endosymbiont of Nebria brevicollis]|uniref:hypothetical protein n=1 Tax=Spiroplasma endosymbiont of Nebria brevicollis TaxID=3066284 RepID=UPI00313E1C28
MTLAIPNHKMFEEKFDEYLHTTEHDFIDLKVIVDSKQLLEDWKNKTKLPFSLDYILNNYVRFEDNLETDIFFDDLDLTFYLLGKNYISKKNIWIVNSWTFSFEENQFNKESKEKNWKKIMDFDEEYVWWLEKDSFKKEINNSNPTWSLTMHLHSSDNLVKELLFKGNQTIRINYCKVNTTLTEKGYEYLNSGFLKNNWKWLGTSLIAVIIPILFKIFWK